MGKVSFDLNKCCYEGGNPVYLARLQDPLMARLAKFFYKAGFTANGMSFFTFLIAISSVFVLIFVPGYKGFVIAAILVFLRNIGDMLDGKIARGTGTTSAFGGFFDLLSDWIIFLPSFFIALGYATGNLVLGFICVIGYMSREFTRRKFTYFYGVKITETNAAKEIGFFVSLIRKYDLGSTFILIPFLLILINPLFILYAVAITEYTLLIGEFTFDLVILYFKDFKKNVRN